MLGKLNPIRVAFAVTAVGTLLVAMAALTEYISIATMPPEIMSPKIVAQRFLLILMLVLISFELALYLLHRFIRNQERVIREQSEELLRYSKRLEELVGNQYGRIKRIMSQFQAITGNLPVILWAVNRRGEIRFAEGSGLKLIDCRGSDIVGKRVEDVFGSGTSVTNHVNFALTGEQISSNDRMRDAWFSSRYAPIKDQDGTVAGAIVVSLDVTDEMRLSSREDTAREHGRHLAEFINSPTMVIGQGHVTLANDAAERHLGYEPGKLLNAAAETVMTPESARLIENNFQPGKSAEQITLDLISRDGRPLPTVFAAHASKVNGHVEVLLIAVGSKPEVGEASAKKAGPTNPPKTRKKSSSRKAPAKRVAPRIISTLRDEPKPKPKKRS